MTREARKLYRSQQRRRYTQNIRRVWHRATPADIAAGANWYVLAQALAREISPNNLERGAGIIAALSPRVKWSRNKLAARLIADYAANGWEQPRIAGLLQRNVSKAWRIAQGESPDAVLRGPKVRAFYRNISGDLTAVTVDVWALKVAGLERDAPTALQYEDVSLAYQSVARAVGVAPAILQASTWVAIRGTAA